MWRSLFFAGGTSKALSDTTLRYHLIGGLKVQLKFYRFFSLKDCFYRILSLLQ